MRDNTVVLDDGQEVEADYVILATGYDAEHQNLVVYGADDDTAHYKSKADFCMYRGIALPGIPNYFTVFGNNMGLNHCELP